MKETKKLIFLEQKWEWRTFEKLERETLEKILELPTIKEKRDSDQYIITYDTGLNIKIRGDNLKIKKLVRREKNLELWDSYLCKSSKLNEELLTPIDKVKTIKNYDNCEIEIAYIKFGNKNFTSIGIDSEDKKIIQTILKKFNLKKYSPMNYTQFIQKNISSLKKKNGGT